MKKNKEIPVIVVSTFSGLDLFLLGMIRAGMLPAYANEFNKYAAQIHLHNHKGLDGEGLIRFVKLTKDEADELFTKLQDAEAEEKRKDYIKQHIEKLPDGDYQRPERIQDIDGREIRKLCHKLYGKNIRIVLIGGPPCQDYSGLNSGKDMNRGELIFEYQRFLGELIPDVAVMEEVVEIIDKNNIAKYHEFLGKCAGLGYRISYKVMNGVLFEGCQARERCFTIMVREDLKKDPVFPEAMPDKAIRVGELLDIDHFFSGHFTDKIKTKRDFMCTVTSGSPLWLSKNFVKRKPTNDELLMFQGVKAEHGFEIPEGIPQDQILQAIGNAVPVNMAYHIGMVITEKIFELEVKNEY